MNPIIEALLFLLQKAHASGNHPDGEAQRLIDAITALFVTEQPAPAAPAPEPQAAQENGNAVETKGREGEDPQGEHTGAPAPVE